MRLEDPVEYKSFYNSYSSYKRPDSDVKYGEDSETFKVVFNLQCLKLEGLTNALWRYMTPREFKISTYNRFVVSAHEIAAGM